MEIGEEEEKRESLTKNVWQYAPRACTEEKKIFRKKGKSRIICDNCGIYSMPVPLWSWNLQKGNWVHFEKCNTGLELHDRNSETYFIFHKKMLVKVICNKIINKIVRKVSQKSLESYNFFLDTSEFMYHKYLITFTDNQKSPQRQLQITKWNTALVL